MSNRSAAEASLRTDRQTDRQTLDFTRNACLSYLYGM